MTEVLQAPLRDQSDIKLFILYLMEHIAKPLDFVEINDIVVQNGVVKPFDFCLAFPDLIETGHVAALTDGNGQERYTVTELGREASQNLSGKILATTKEKALENAILLLNLRKNNATYRYHIEKTPAGKYLFVLQYAKDNVDTLTLTALCDTQKEAENMALTLEEHPDMTERALYSLLRNNAHDISEYAPLALL